MVGGGGGQRAVVLMFSGTGKAFGYAALVRRVRSRARRRWVECRRGKESRQAPWGDKMTLPEGTENRKFGQNEKQLQ